MTSDAKLRLNNVKLSQKKLYMKALQAILYLVNSGQIQGKINDHELKELLRSISSRERRDFKITRK